MRKQTREQSLVKSDKAPDEVGFYASLLFLFAHRILVLQCDILLVIYFHWNDRIHIAHAMFGSIIWSLHKYYFYVVDIWEFFTTYSCTPYWQTTLYCRCVTSMIHKLLVETLMYMHGSRYVVILLVKLCEGSPPKNTCDVYWWFVWGESPRDHLWYLLMMVTMWKRDICMFHVEFINFSCRYMPLDDPWNFLLSVPLLWNVFKIVSVVGSSCNFFCG